MLLLALALSLLVGVSLGLLGGGGSILTLPILVYVLGMPEKEAIATSLIVVGVTSAVAAVSHARRGNVEWRTGAWFAAAGAAGAFVGGTVAEGLPAALLWWGFVGMMALTAVAMLVGRRDEAAAPAAPRLPVAKVLLQGAAVGLVTGLVGAGGGFVVVPALVLLGGLPMPKAIGTSLVVITVNTLAGGLGHAMHATIDPVVTGLVSAMAVVGALAGGALAPHVPASALRRGFGVLVLLIAAGMVWAGR